MRCSIHRPPHQYFGGDSVSSQVDTEGAAAAISLRSLVEEFDNVLDLAVQTVTAEASTLDRGAASSNQQAWQPVEDISDRTAERYQQFRQRYEMERSKPR